VQPAKKQKGKSGKAKASKANKATKREDVITPVLDMVPGPATKEHTEQGTITNDNVITTAPPSPLSPPL
jgi:hypothetical protein